MEILYEICNKNADYINGLLNSHIINDLAQISDLARITQLRTLCLLIEKNAKDDSEERELAQAVGSSFCDLLNYSANKSGDMNAAIPFLTTACIKMREPNRLSTLIAGTIWNHIKKTPSDLEEISEDNRQNLLKMILCKKLNPMPEKLDRQILTEAIRELEQKNTKDALTTLRLAQALFASIFNSSPEPSTKSNQPSGTNSPIEWSTSEDDEK